MVANGELISITIKSKPTPFKFVIGDCWRNISYKKFIRLTKKCSRKSVLIFIKQWEKATGLSRYDAYFQRVGKVVTFSIWPILSNPDHVCNYRTIKLKANELAKLDVVTYD